MHFAAERVRAVTPWTSHRPEPGAVHRFRALVQSAGYGVVPGQQDLTGSGVEVTGVGVIDRERGTG
jgi:hypothetical protein